MQKIEEREAVTLWNNGQKIFGIFHRPLNAKRVPAVIFCPGFAGNKSGKFRLAVKVAQELAKRGIASLRFDYCGTGDSEGEFEEITIKGEFEDVQTCIQFLSQDAQIDANRLGLVGRSLGGLIAILAAESNPCIKSLVLWAPVFHSDPWKKMWREFESKQAEWNHRGQSLPLPINVPNLQFLKEFFNLNLHETLRRLGPLPLLHIQGACDTTVGADHQQAYQQARKGMEEATRFLWLPKSDHDFSDAEERQILIQETYQWFEKTL